MANASDSSSPSHRRLKLAVGVSLRLLAGIGLMWLVLSALVPDAEALVRRARLQPWWLVASLLASAAGTLVTARRWQVLSESLGGARLPLADYAHALSWTRLLAQFLPALLVEIVGRSSSLRAAGSHDSWTRLSGVIILERLTDLVLPLVLLGWATLGLTPPLTWVALALITVLSLTLTARSMRPAAVLVARLRARVRAQTPPPIPTLAAEVRRRIVVLSALRYAALVTQFGALGAAVGVALTPSQLIPASALAQLAMLIAVTPGGLGFQEGGWAAGLTWQGVDPTSAAVFILAARVGMIVNFAIITLATRLWIFSCTRARPRDAD